MSGNVVHTKQSIKDDMNQMQTTVIWAAEEQLIRSWRAGIYNKPTLSYHKKSRHFSHSVSKATMVPVVPIITTHSAPVEYLGATAKLLCQLPNVTRTQGLTQSYLVQERSCHNYLIWQGFERLIFSIKCFERLLFSALFITYLHMSYIFTWPCVNTVQSKFMASRRHRITGASWLEVWIFVSRITTDERSELKVWSQAMR